MAQAQHAIQRMTRATVTLVEVARATVTLLTPLSERLKVPMPPDPDGQRGHEDGL